MSTHYDFLKDEENIKLLGKISNLVDSQLPQFVKNEGGNFFETTYWNDLSRDAFYYVSNTGQTQATVTYE